MKENEQNSFSFIKAFVESNPSIKWCPFPECNMAVNNPYLNQNQDTLLIKDNTNALLQDEKREYSKSVDCGAGHYFCWDCLQEGHEPATCENWKNWYEKIRNMKPEECKF
jgi:ankyrin repeat/IBR domain-containing protein 1